MMVDTVVTAVTAPLGPVGGTVRVMAMKWRGVATRYVPGTASVGWMVAMVVGALMTPVPVYSSVTVTKTAGVWTTTARRMLVQSP